MALTIENYTDLITTTQKQLGRLKWTDIAFSLQEYHALPQILKAEKVQYDDGYAIQWNVRVRNSDAAKNVGLYEADTTDVVDVMKTASIPWRHTTSSYSFDIREPKLNGGASKIVDLVKAKRAAGLGSLAELMETNVVTGVTASTDETTPYGFQYWLVPNATTGFNGGNHAQWSSGPGGLSATTYSGWKHFSGYYTDSTTKSGIVPQMREAYTKIQFKAPIEVPQYTDATGGSYVVYVPYSVLQDLEDIGEGQNDNLGRDIASLDGMITFRRCPVKWMAALDTYTSMLPVIMVNWNVFRPVFLNGWYMREDTRPAPNQHTVVNTFIDSTWNIQCLDRRRLAILTKTGTTTWT